MTDRHHSGSIGKATPPSLRHFDGREWWLWGLAVVVTLVLTCGILSLTYPGEQWLADKVYFQNLREWVRGLAALVLLFDIHTIYQHSQIQRMRQRFAERERLFYLITENAADMIGVVDRDGRRLYNSPAYEKILGYSSEELSATTSHEQVHPDDLDRVVAAAEKAWLTGRGDRLEYRIRHKDGSWRVLESSASAIPGANGGVEGLVIVNRDITRRKQVESLLEHRSFHDALTNLPNRPLFLDRLQRAIAVAERHGDFKFAVLFIDIDKFQVFNDSLGHAAGDELIVEIAKRLTACLRGADTVARGRRRDAGSATADNTLARPGGDEFIVLAAELRDPSDAVRLAKRIHERLSPPFVVNGHEVVISASIGIVCSDSKHVESEDMLRDAEIAMFRAKHNGGGRYEVFDRAMQAEAVKRLQLETDLRKALDADEFRVYYQPIVCLRNGQIVGFEALTRWQRPEGMVSPAQFIDVAAEIGIIIPLNRKLLRQACQQLRRWQSYFSCDPPLAVSVNITPKEFAQPDLAAQIDSILRQTGLDPSVAEFEITENVAMADSEGSARVLAKLKALGVGLSIDDFGTGFSSLARLQHFPVNKLKIDRSFISGANGNPQAEEIVRAIVMLAHNLKLQVVAEGIENKDQMKLVRQMGCELGQGYFFSKPIDADDVERLLETRQEMARMWVDELTAPSTPGENRYGARESGRAAVQGN